MDPEDNPSLSQPQEPCLARIFILGAGRSGTSLLTSLFSKSEFFMGDQFYLSREANPLGFYEDREVNAINENLIAAHLPDRRTIGLEGYAQDIPTQGQRWLARLEVNTTIEADPSIQERIQALFRRGATCFKDPRFCYTLEAWKQCLSKDEAALAKHLCIFRHPSVVISSVLKEVRSAAYLSTLAISVQQAFENWVLLYQHILEKHSQQGMWHFVDYESLFTPEGLDSIVRFTGIEIDAGFVKAELNRSKPELDVPDNAIKVYQNLIENSRISALSKSQVVYHCTGSSAVLLEDQNPGVVIWHVGRCGSSVLGHCYNQNPHMQWENEIFNRYMPQHIGTGTVPVLDAVISEVRQRQQRDFQLIEVKFLEDQHPGIFGLTSLELAGVLREYGYKNSVILERRNILRRMISHCLASQTNIYHISSSQATPSRQAIRININEIQVGRTTRSLLEWLDLIKASHEELKKSLGAINGFLHLTYEDHVKFNPIKGYEAMCDHLLIPRTPVQVVLQPTNPFSMSDVISNYEELDHFISSTEHAWMLEDED